MRLSQVRILTDDSERSHRFYRGVVGLASAYGDEGDAHTSFDAGAGTVSIFPPQGQAEGVALRGGGDGSVLVLEADDLDREAVRLAAAGASLVGSVTDRPDRGIRVLHLRDPDGNVIEIVEPLQDPRA